MAFANSIYNVSVWELETPYVKDDIVSKIEFVSGAGSSDSNKVPKKIKYYYAIADSLGKDPENEAGDPITDHSKWKGYSKVGKEYKPNFFWFLDSFPVYTIFNECTLRSIGVRIFTISAESTRKSV